jgi:hypothetical protein
MRCRSIGRAFPESEVSRPAYLRLGNYLGGPHINGIVNFLTIAISYYPIWEKYRSDFSRVAFLIQRSKS